MVCLCHVGFRTLALLVYLFGGMFSSSFIGVFVSVVLLLSIDFWTVKNITGRILVSITSIIFHMYFTFLDYFGDSSFFICYLGQACFFNAFPPPCVPQNAEKLSLSKNSLSLAKNTLSLAKNSLSLEKNLEFRENSSRLIEISIVLHQLKLGFSKCTLENICQTSVKIVIL